MTRSVKRNPDVVGEVLDGETVLLNLSTGTYYSLNRTGTRMWELIGELGDVELVASRLEQEYESDPATLRRDLGELVNSLVSRGLATESE